MLSADIQRVVIIGAGQAGGETVQRLRQNGYEGEISLIGEESYPPYQRPPLSKKYLAGELETQRLYLRPAEIYAQERAALLTGVRAVWIDRASKKVRLEGGREVAYDALVLATGAKPRTLPIAGADLPGSHTCRTLSDIDAMRPRFKPGAKLIVVGAGYIGLEIAAVARQKGLDVTVIETAPRPLTRVTSPEIAGFYLDEHTSQGVRFLLGGQLALIMGKDEVTGVKLADGTEIPANLVVAGIGVNPDIGLAQQCGLATDNGIVTDAQCRTSDPSIYAIGDCASRPMQHYDGRQIRLESVHNALESAKIAAAAIAGKPVPVLEAPWFWSDQYDLKLQIAGLFQGFDKIVIRGDMKARAFACCYYKQGRVIAVDAVNRPGEFIGVKTMLQKGVSVPPEVMADDAKPIKEIMALAT
jgi:3-phenylpropionate/trans-cinnamate dioxygenase ferredoxin reductase subunit